MQISELVAVKRLHLRFLTGAEHQHRTVRWAYTTDLLEPARYLRGGEFVLTGMMWRTRPEDSETFVASVVSAGAVAIGAGTALARSPRTCRPPARSTTSRSSRSPPRPPSARSPKRSCARSPNAASPPSPRPATATAA